MKNQRICPLPSGGRLTLTIRGIWSFHRNPLEVVLRFLPQGARSRKVEVEKDYQIHLFAYDQRENPVLYLNFIINDWHRGLQRELPLYLVHGQEKGRELGAFLLEMTQMER